MKELTPIITPSAPDPLGNYVHAMAVGDLLFLSGIASRHPTSNEVPGLVLDDQGIRLSYDIKAETRATLENIRAILLAGGSDFEHVIDVQVFLRDMQDFASYNEVFAEFFPSHKPARTTIGVAGLPGQISIEMKVTALKK